MTLRLVETRKIHIFREQNIFNTLKSNINNFLKSNLSEYKFRQPTTLHEGLPFNIEPELPRLEIKSITNDIIIILAVERLDVIFTFDNDNNNYNILKNIFSKFDDFLINQEFYPTRLAMQGTFLYRTKNPETMLLNIINKSFTNPIEPMLQFGERYTLENSNFYINDTYTLQIGIEDNIIEKNKVVIIKRDLNTNETPRVLDQNIINLFNTKLDKYIEENKIHEYLGI
ncbi:hypothetical protein [Acinetobacter soli]|uniref:hypothetical protein n=1 Tax=Acinetobacter soli TaxID=487316 RepID=UPI0032B38B9E